MRIAIDARMIKQDSMHGIARYVFHLLDCLRTVQSAHQFYVLVNNDSPLLGLAWPESMQLVKVSAEWISFREQWEVPKILRALKADLFHTPSFIAPFACPVRFLMTIHDLNHLVLPQFYTPLHQLYYQAFVRRCIYRSEAILTVSHFSKSEILRTLRLPFNKVHVTYNGVADHYHPVSDKTLLNYVRDIYELPAQFVFCLTNTKPHKNVHQLIRAYCHANLKIPLVLASPVDRNAIRIAEHFGKKHLIYFTRFIHEEHLPAVYTLSHLFVYPSTYEGFGLPPLEALACGTPVVVARSSSLPEVVGENAIFANPYDYEDIARALELGVKDEARRQKLRALGPKHARKFSWENMTKDTLHIYDLCQTRQTADYYSRSAYVRPL